MYILHKIENIPYVFYECQVMEGVGQLRKRITK